MSTSPNILFLTRWYPDRYDPMPGLFIKRHAEVVAEFARVAVLYLRAAPEKRMGFEMVQSAENGVFTLKVYYGTKTFLPSFLSKPLAGFLFIISFVKGYKFLLNNWHKPGIVHANVLTRVGMFALALRWFAGIPYVITEHWSRYLPLTGTYSGFLRKFLTRLVVRNAAAVSTVTVNLAKAMQQHGLQNKHYTLLPNVVDTDEYSPSDGRIETGVKRFIHISCFEDRSKNISGLLHTLARLSEVRSDFECILVGEGMDLDLMKKLANDLNLATSRVRFTGLLENQDVVMAYREADFMVMFSNYENMPVVISEALACGLPVVATAVGGIPEFVNADNGRLIAARDEDALLEAICFMLDHSHEYDRQKIRQNAVQVFGKPAVASKLKELYSFANSRL